MPKHSKTAQDINTAKAVDTLLTDQNSLIRQLSDRLANLEASEKSAGFSLTSHVCSLQKTVNQLVANGATDVILFDTEFVDTDNMHSTVSNTGQIVVPLTGKYIISSTVHILASGTGIILRLNGVTTILPEYAATIALSLISTSIVYPLTANDYVELLYHNASGAGRTMLGVNTFFSVIYLGA